jgi:hypothetical protein
MLFHSSEYVTGPRIFGCNGSHQEKPMRERVPAGGKPNAGDDGRLSFELRLGATEQTPGGPARRCKRERLRRQDRRGEGQEGKTEPVTALSSGVGETLKGASNPTSVDPGKPGQEWMAEQAVEVVETARTEHSG